MLFLWLWCFYLSDSKGLSDQVKILQEDREFLRNRIISMAAGKMVVIKVSICVLNTKDLKLR